MREYRDNSTSSVTLEILIQLRASHSKNGPKPKVMVNVLSVYTETVMLIERNFARMVEVAIADWVRDTHGLHRYFRRLPLEWKF